MIELTHIGEALIAEMLNSSVKVRELFCIEKGDMVAVPEIPLVKCGQYGFDVSHKINVGLLIHDSRKCLPIEAKLGADRLDRESFDKRFLRPCVSAREEKRITGSMTAILDRKIPVSADEKIQVVYKENSYALTQEWVLVVREKVLASWVSNGRPSLSPNCRIIAMENIVSVYGDAAAFNALVSKVISGDYHRQWFS